MLPAYLIGMAIGAIAQQAVDDRAEQYKAQYPLPEPMDATGDATEAAASEAPPAP